MQVGNGQMLRDTVGLWTGPKRVTFGVGSEEATADMANAAAINSTFVRDVTTLAEHINAIGVAPPQVKLTVAQGAHPARAQYFGERFAAALLFSVRNTGGEVGVSAV